MKTEDPIFIVVDLFCGAALLQSNFSRGKYSSIYQCMMRGAKYPKHVSLIDLQGSESAISFMLWFVRKVNYSTFFTVFCFAAFRQIRILFIKPLNNSILSAIFSSAPFIVIFHSVGVRIFKTPGVLSISLNLADFRTIGSYWATAFRYIKFLIALSAYSRFVAPIFIIFYPMLPLGSAWYRAIHLRVVVCHKISVANRANLHEFSVQNLAHFNKMLLSINIQNKSTVAL
jgi:hypothetical protein